MGTRFEILDSKFEANDEFATIRSAWWMFNQSVGVNEESISRDLEHRVSGEIFARKPAVEVERFKASADSWGQ
jgi:hypothetical protein